MSEAIPQPIPQPPTRRVFWAFLAAPVAGALTAGLIMALVAMEPMVGLGVAGFGLALFAAPATTLLGLPIWLAVRRRMRLSPARCATVGSLIAGAPLLLITAPMLVYATMARDVVEALMIPIAATAGGAVGGVVFWAVATRRGEI